MNCRKCGEPMIRVKWNSSVDIVTCNNSPCELFRQPSSTIPCGESTLANDLAPFLERGFPRKRARKPKLISPEEFMDEEETSPAVKDLRRMRKRLFAEKENPEVL